MTQKKIISGTVDEFPQVSQRLKLACRQCGKQAAYDVGNIYSGPVEKGAAAEENITFTGYFRCVGCGSAGPWNVVDHFKLLGIMLRGLVARKAKGMFACQIAL